MYILFVVDILDKFVLLIFFIDINIWKINILFYIIYFGENNINFNFFGYFVYVWGEILLIKIDLFIFI